MSHLKRLVIGAVLLALLTWHAHAQAGPTTAALDSTGPQAAVSPTTFLPGDDIIGAAAGTQDSPAIARGSSSTLAVWADYRSRPDGAFYELETASDIYGMRLNASGSPLDAVPFPIAQGRAAQTRPRVAWNGSNWLVVFETIGLHGTGYYYQSQLAAVRVSPAGQVLDPEPIPLHNALPNSGDWAVASDGSNWTVVFQGTAAAIDLMAIRIAPNGTVLDPPTISLVPASYYLRFNPRLAYANGVYLLAWDDLNDTRAIRFDQNLNLLDAAPFQLLPTLGLKQLISNGSLFYVVWQKQMPDFSIAVTGSRVSLAGALLDGAGDNISGANQPQSYTPIGVTWDGSIWIVNWTSNSVVRGARITASGQVADFGGIPLPALPSSGDLVATAPGRVQLIWQTFTGGETDVVTANVFKRNVGPTRTLSSGAPAQTRPEMAIGSSGSMVVFRSDTATENRVLAQPLDASGSPLTAAPILLDSGPRLTGPGTPGVAWNGSLYLVTWSNSSGIVAQRLRQDGTLLDPAPFLVMTSGFGPANTAALGDTFLVVGRQYGYTPQVIYPIGARVRGSDGAVLDSTRLVLGGSFTRNTAVTTFDNRWLVVYQRNFTHDNPLADSNAVFVNASGTIGPSFLVYGYYSTGGGNGAFDLDVAGGASTALMVQSAELTSGVETDMLGVIINPNGTTRPVVNFTPYEGNQYRPRVAWDGSQFVVAYTDQKNRFALHTMDQLDARGDLFGMRVSAAGFPIDPTGFAFATTPIGELNVSVASANGVSLMAGALMRNQAPFAAYRIGYTRFGVGGNQWPVSVPTADVAGGNVPLTVAFSSAGSSDPDGTVAAYLWDFGDGATSTAPNPSHTYTTAGNYVATLTVTDNQGTPTVNTVRIAAENPNVLPIAAAAANTLSGRAPLNVTFSAAGSYDPDGSLGNFQWSFSNGGTYWGSTAYQTFSQPGTYTATLTVFDNRGGTGTNTLTITVTP